MRILRPGTGQKGWSTEATCTGAGNGGGGCGARLLVEQHDLFLTYRNARDETDTFVTFECGACGVLNDLPGGRVPHAIETTLPSHKAWRELQEKKMEIELRLLAAHGGG